MNTLTLIGRAATLVRLALDDRLPPGMGDDMREISVAMRDYHDASRALVAELAGALAGITEIAAHRWRALPAGTPEKQRIAGAQAALAHARAALPQEGGGG